MSGVRVGRKRLTAAKCQRAISAIVEVIESEPEPRVGTDWELERACDRLRELMAQANR